MGTMTGNQGVCEVYFYQHYFGEYVNTFASFNYVITPTEKYDLFQPNLWCNI